MLDQWAEAIDRLIGDIEPPGNLKPGQAAKEPAPAQRNEPPPFSPPLELWAEAVDRLLDG